MTTRSHSVLQRTERASRKADDCFHSVKATSGESHQLACCLDGAPISIKQKGVQHELGSYRRKLETATG